jgi:formate dehydrogenase subunit delta
LNPEYLVTMANDISHFFAAEQDREQAVKLIAAHLKRYWDPRMRRDVVAYYRQGGEGFEDSARRAIALLADEAPPAR